MMKVLWLTNCVIPAVSKAMGQKSHFVNEGWISMVLDQLVSDPHIEMTIVCDQHSSMNNGSVQLFNWYTISGDYTENKKRTIFEAILRNTQPDIIHIWGSEYPHTLTMLQAAYSLGIKNRVVISLQGIIYAIANHYQSYLPAKAMSCLTFHDIIRRYGLVQQEESFRFRGEYEKAAFKMAEHVIGRTDWDKYCVTRINNNLIYHKCNETLRNVFYTGEWNYEECVRHSIFISQASYPIKGFHILLEALPKLRERYPDISVFVAGPDIVSDNTFMGRLKRSGYGKYLRGIINKYNLWNSLHFLGPLNAEEMKKMYLKSNVFVSSSSIENSPNSVGEAMILGCPIVSSNVGGVSSIMKPGIDGLTYPADDYYMLEKEITWFFDNPSESIVMGKNARAHAKLTHDAETNRQRIVEIYSLISCEQK